METSPIQFPDSEMIRIFYLVFSQLTVGGFVLLLLIPKGLVGRSFYRLMGAIYLLTIILARCANLSINSQTVDFKNFFLLWSGEDALFPFLMFLILLGYTASSWLKSPAINRFLLFTGTVLGLIWIVYSAQPYLLLINLPVERVLLPFQFLASSALLGVVNSGMWFGHWYLVTPNLPVIHLKRFNQVFLISLLLSSSLFTLNLVLRLRTSAAVPLNIFYDIVLGMRVIIGFGGSFLAYLIVWYCLRNKAVEQGAVGATRAATGFLYIAMLTVFVGEFCGRLLLLEMRFIL